MGFEDEAPWLEKRIDACEPPRRLALSNEGGDMRIELLLSEIDGETELQLVHHLDPTDDISAYGRAGSTTSTCSWQLKMTCDAEL